ncbi:MAG: serine/threonine-protein kinase [Myxococcales bacterium]
MSTSQVNIPAADAGGDPLVGTVLAGRYLVEKRVGEGGMGLVYAGVHRDIGKRVAIKVLREELSRRPEVVARFRQEAKSASRIGHEHIVDVFDFGETARGSSYFIMEFLEGEDLGNVLGRQVTIEAERACSIVLQCCHALAAAHDKGIVHRDIKPENVFLSKREGTDDFVKIVDFGIAKMSDIETDGAPGRKLTKTGMIFGTPEYMSPEQAAGKELDHRVDIYALGIILYECLAGRVPFQGDTFMGVLTQHLFAELPPIRRLNSQAQVSAELELVIRKALAKSPDDRYQDAEELADALTCALEGRLSPATALAPPPDAVPQSIDYLDALPRPKSSRWLWGASLVAALAAVGWVGVAQTAGTQGKAPTGEELSVAPDPAVLGMAQAPKEPPRAEPMAAIDDARGGQDTVSTVKLHVATDPSGARLSFGDGSDACETTPCTIDAQTGSTLVLHAKLGKRRGRVAVTPAREDTVLIELAAPPRARTRTNREGVAASKRSNTRPIRASDLKVPEWAQ